MKSAPLRLSLGRGVISPSNKARIVTPPKGTLIGISGGTGYNQRTPKAYPFAPYRRLQSFVTGAAFLTYPPGQFWTKFPQNMLSSKIWSKKGPFVCERRARKVDQGKMLHGTLSPLWSVRCLAPRSNLTQLAGFCPRSGSDSTGWFYFRHVFN